MELVARALYNALAMKVSQSNRNCKARYTSQGTKNQPLIILRNNQHRSKPPGRRRMHRLTLVKQLEVCAVQLPHTLAPQLYQEKEAQQNRQVPVS